MVTNILVLAGVLFVAMLAVKALSGFLKAIVLILVVLAGVVFLGLRMEWFSERDVDAFRKDASKKGTEVIKKAKEEAGKGVEKGKETLKKELMEEVQ